MDQKFVQKMKEKLSAEKARIESELQNIGNRDPHNPDNFDSTFPDFGGSEDDNALETTIYNDRVSQEQALEDTLGDINAALDRIEKGVYGVCKYCKREIPEERLAARPEAGACIECKKKLTMEP